MRNNWKIALIILVVLNVAILSILWIKETQRSARQEPTRPELTRGQGKEHPIVRRLGFDEGQKKQFEQSLTRHFKVLRPIEDEMHRVRTQLFTSASEKSDEAQFTSQLDQLNQLQRAADSVSYVHFHEVNEICRDDQKAEFKKLLGRMINQGQGRGGGMIGILTKIR